MGFKNYKKFLVLYNSYFKKIYQYVFYRTGRNKQLAEDLTSEIFLKALENFSDFDESVGKFNSWLYMIAQNHIIDHYRTSKSQVSIDEIAEIANNEQSLSEKLSIKQEYSRVIHAIYQLPDMYQDILVLKYINQFSNKEIAEILHKSPGSIRVTLHRATKVLISKLNNNEKK